MRLIERILLAVVIAGWIIASNYAANKKIDTTRYMCGMVNTPDGEWEHSCWDQIGGYSSGTISTIGSR
jgi:hypothetical protein